MCLLDHTSFFTPTVGPPFFTYRPESVTALTGEIAILFCGGGGRPRPTVTWHRIRGSIHRGIAEEITADGRLMIGDPFLLFNQVELSDEGFYFCTLTSPLANRTSNKAFLNVYSECRQSVEIRDLSHSPSSPPPSLPPS